MDRIESAKIANFISKANDSGADTPSIAQFLAEHEALFISENDRAFQLKVWMDSRASIRFQWDNGYAEDVDTAYMPTVIWFSTGDVLRFEEGETLGEFTMKTPCGRIVHIEGPKAFTKEIAFPPPPLPIRAAAEGGAWLTDIITFIEPVKWFIIPGEEYQSNARNRVHP